MMPLTFADVGEEYVVKKIGGRPEVKKHLEKLGFDVTWVVGEGYTHEWRFWNREVEAFLDWIPRTDAYYNGGEKRKI